MWSRRAALGFGLMALLLACACGGSSTSSGPPSSSGSQGSGASTHDAAVETFAEVHPDDVAEVNRATGSNVASAPTAGGASAEPPDECTPLGVDLEKQVRPQLKECYREGKKKEPNLEGTVRLAIDVDTLGKVRTVKIEEKTLPDPVAQCMLKAVKAAPKTQLAKCPGKTITIPVTFPTPR